MSDKFRIDLEAGLDASSWARMIRSAEAEVRGLKGRLDRVMQGGDMLGGTGSSPHSARAPSYGIQPASRYGGFSGYFGRMIFGRGSAEGGAARLTAGLIGFGGGMMSLPGQIMGGVNTARRQEQELSNLNRRVGESIQTYANFRQEVLATGEALGNTRQQIIQMTNDYVSSVGRMSTMKLSQDLTYGQQLAKGLGVAPELIMGAFGSLSRNMQGPATNTTMLGQTLAASIDRGGMRGRESEVVKAIEDLTDLMGQRIPTVTPMMFQGVASLMTAMNASGIQGLTGSRGEQLIGGLNSFLQGGGGAQSQYLLYRGIQAASQAGGGGTLGIPQMMRLSQEGVGSPLMVQTIQQIVKAYAGMPGMMSPSGKPSDWMSYMLSQTLKMSMDQIDELIPIVMSLKPGETLPAGAIKNVTLTAQDEATKALNDFHNSLLNAATTLMPAVTGGLKGMSDVIGGANGVVSMLMGLGHAAAIAQAAVITMSAVQVARGGFSAFQAVRGLGSVPGAVMRPGVSAGDLSAMERAAVGSSVLSRAKGFGSTLKYGAGIGAALTGLNVIGDIATGQSPWRDIFSGVGGTLGSIGGGMLGTAVLPGVGTAVGAIGGGMAGNWAGGALYDMLFGNQNPSTASQDKPADALASIDDNTKTMVSLMRGTGGAAASVGGTLPLSGLRISGLGGGNAGIGASMANAMASLLGVGVPAGAAGVFGAQAQLEGANSYNNPFNLRPIPGGWPGQTGVTSGGFAIFSSMQAGINAAAQNYMAGNYTGVRSAFLGGNPMSLARAIEASPWDSGHYGRVNLERLVAQLGNLEGSLDVNLNLPDNSTQRASAVVRTGPYKNVLTRSYGYGSN